MHLGEYAWIYCTCRCRILIRFTIHKTARLNSYTELPLPFSSSTSIILVMSQTFKLYRLQQIDSQIDHLHSRLREIAAALAEDSDLRHAQARYSTAQKKLAEVNKVLRKAEADVQAQQIKIEQTEAALYGGKVRNPKELQDLHKESAALGRYLKVLEDRQLEVMLAVEESENELMAASATHETVLDDSTKQKASLLTEQAALLKELEIQQSERQAAAS